MASNETLGRRADQRQAQILPPGEGLMSSEVTKPDEVALRARLATLVQEHRDLDAAIEAMEKTGSDQLALSRLKKRKLYLKDEIAEISTNLLPDIIA